MITKAVFFEAKKTEIFKKHSGIRSILYIIVLLKIFGYSRGWIRIFTTSIRKKCNTVTYIDMLYTLTLIYVYVYMYIHRHVFRPSQDLSGWLGLTSREQLTSPECSKHQVLIEFYYIEFYFTEFY